MMAGACKVGPDYEVPDPFVPDAWKTAVAQELADEDSPIQMWFVRLNDPQLAVYVQEAIASNRDFSATKRT